MKQAVSVSIGSSRRDKAVEIELLGEQVHLERTGTNGDMDQAARMFEEMDGKVDAFGMGGADLGVMVVDRWYSLHSAAKMVRNVRRTPVADGNGLKATLEVKAAGIVDRELGGYVQDKKVFIITAVDRWGLARGFLEAGYDYIFGDLMFALGLPLPVRSVPVLKAYAGALLPLVSRVPFHWLYPVGKEQEKRTPKWEKQFHWASVIAGDCHYIRRYMPERMDGKVVVTNTTTPEDQEIFRRAGVKYLITTTPVLEGRSFGTNMMEAALLAALGWKERVDYAHAEDYFRMMAGVVDRLNMRPQIQEL